LKAKPIRFAAKAFVRKENLIAFGISTSNTIGFCQRSGAWLKTPIGLKVTQQQHWTGSMAFMKDSGRKNFTASLGKAIGPRPACHSYLTDRNSFLTNRNLFLPAGNSFLPDCNSFLPDRSPLLPDHDSFPPDRNSFLPDRDSFLPARNYFLPARRVCLILDVLFFNVGLFFRKIKKNKDYISMTYVMYIQLLLDFFKFCKIKIKIFC
jgi:hypothetical protein